MCMNDIWMNAKCHENDSLMLRLSSRKSILRLYHWRATLPSCSASISKETLNLIAPHCERQSSIHWDIKFVPSISHCNLRVERYGFSQSSPIAIQGYRMWSSLVLYPIPKVSYQMLMHNCKIFFSEKTFSYHSVIITCLFIEALSPKQHLVILFNQCLDNKIWKDSL